MLSQQKFKQSPAWPPVLQPKQMIATKKEKVLKKEPMLRMQTKNRRNQLQRYQQAVSHQF